MWAAAERRPHGSPLRPLVAEHFERFLASLRADEGAREAPSEGRLYGRAPFP